MDDRSRFTGWLAASLLAVSGCARSEIGSTSSSSDGGAGGAATFEGPSCTGTFDCWEASCCDEIIVPGGTFPMGRSTGGTDAFGIAGAEEIPEHMVTVTTYALDTFEVTVGRFRRYVESYDGTPPAEGAGAHPLIADSGWQTDWNGHLAESRAALVSQLKSTVQWDTWTDTPGPNESMPINCVDFWTAFAFCVWDGKRLPTEAEWEYAAAGGAENRLYPWGAEDPSVITVLANSQDSEQSPFVAVGSHPAGNGLWGHRDLAGGLAEWVLDAYDATWYSGGGASCNDCANLDEGTVKVVRGGSMYGGPDNLRAAHRQLGPVFEHSSSIGFRCARTP